MSDQITEIEETETDAEPEQEETGDEKDETSEKPAEGSSTKTMLYVGAGVAAVGALGWWWMRRRREQEQMVMARIADEERAAAEAKAARDRATAIFRKAPVARIDTTSMPMLRLVAKTDEPEGDPYFVLGDALAPYLAVGLQALFTDATKNALVAPPNAGLETLPSNGVIHDLLSALLGGAKPPSAGLWFVAVGPTQRPVDIPSAKEDIAKIRARIGPQRVLWTLSASAPASIAQALSESAEEWMRARSDDPKFIALDAANTAAAPDKPQLDNAIPST